MSEPLQFLARGGVPQPRGFIPTGGGELLAVGVEGDGVDSIVMT